MTNIEFLNSISKTPRKNSAMSILFDEWDFDLEVICSQWKSKRMKLWSVLYTFYLDYNKPEGHKNKIIPIGKTREEQRQNLLKLLQSNYKQYQRSKDRICDQWVDPEEKKSEKKIRYITLESGETVVIKCR